jgi:hypothetical protein
MRSKPTLTRSAAYPAHPVMSIFSGSVLFASARRQIRYFQRYSVTANTPCTHHADSATGYTTQNAEPRIRIVYFHQRDSFIRIDFLHDITALKIGKT